MCLRFLTMKILQPKRSILFTCLFPACIFLLSCEALLGDRDCLEKIPQNQRCFDSGLSQITQNLTQSPIFSDTELINTPNYIYTNGNLNNGLPRDIEVRTDDSVQELLGLTDCCNIVSALNKVDTEPIFEWNSVNNELIAVAIFESNVKLSSDLRRIENVEEAIWTWNTGIGGETKNSNKTRVSYSQGKDIIDGEITESITPLEPGKVYTWAVWAWNAQGTSVEKSSISIPFLVEQAKSIPLVNIFQLATSSNESWLLQSAINLSTMNDESGSFPFRDFQLFPMCNPDDDTLSIVMYESSTYPQNIDFFENSSRNVNGWVDILVGDYEFSEFEFSCDEFLTVKAIDLRTLNEYSLVFNRSSIE